MPQAWSLGLEMTFYLLIPWIIRYFSLPLITILIVLSMTVFGAAFSGKITPDWYGFRLLPGTLFMFLAGSLFYRKEGIYKILITFIFVTAGALLLLAYQHDYIYKFTNIKEALIGILIGIPVLGILSKFRFSALDEFLGNLSYGIFLNHFMFIYLGDIFFPMVDHYTRVAIVMLASCLAALASYFLVEVPALRWRHQFRKSLKPAH